MKIVLIVGVLLIMGIIGATVFMGDGSSDTKAESLKFSTVESDVQAGSVFIDVRTPEEYAAGYIAGAENLPLANLQSGQLPDVSKDTKVYVYCRSGNRSAQAKSVLESAGHTNVIDLGGLEQVVSIGGKQI